MFFQTKLVRTIYILKKKLYTESFKLVGFSREHLILISDIASL